MKRVLMVSLLLATAAVACSGIRQVKAPDVVSQAPPAAAHADHSPKHGGIFFMAPDGFHHLEGTYPEAGLFRLYLYDDHTQPIDAQPFVGSIHLESAPEDQRITLRYDSATRTLVGALDPASPLPLPLELFLQLKDPKTGDVGERLFNFQFTRVGGEPMAAHAHGADGHSHVAPHGGQVESVGADYHFELVDSGGLLTLWLLDAELRPLDVGGMEASLLIQPAGKSPITLPMPPMGTVHFMASSPLRSGESAIVVASVRIAGKTESARFTLGSGS